MGDIKIFVCCHTPSAVLEHPLLVPVQVGAALAEAGVPTKAVRLCSAGRDFVPQGAVGQLRRLCGLDRESLYKAAMEVWKHG